MRNHVSNFQVSSIKIKNERILDIKNFLSFVCLSKKNLYIY